MVEKVTSIQYYLYDTDKFIEILYRSYVSITRDLPLTIYFNSSRHVYGTLTCLIDKLL